MRILETRSFGDIPLHLHGREDFLSDPLILYYFILNQVNIRSMTILGSTWNILIELSVQ